MTNPQTYKTWQIKTKWNQTQEYDIEEIKKDTEAVEKKVIESEESSTETNTHFIRRLKEDPTSTDYLSDVDINSRILSYNYKNTTKPHETHRNATTHIPQQILTNNRESSPEFPEPPIITLNDS